MLGVGGAAAVAGKHHLAAGAEALFERLRNGEHGGAKFGIAGRMREHVERTAEMRGSDIVVRHYAIRMRGCAAGLVAAGATARKASQASAASTRATIRSAGISRMQR